MLRPSAALVVSVLTLAGASQNPRDTPLTDSPKASISGRVLAAGTDDPIRNARVAIEGGADTIPPAMSDGEGAFVFSDLAPGRYTVSARKAGYAKTVVGAADDSLRRIDVPDGAHVDGVELRLAKSAAIAGRVVDQFDEPLATANVVAEAVGDGRGNSPGRIVAMAATDDQGEYRLGGLPAGSFIVGVQAVDALTGLGLPPPPPPGSAGANGNGAIVNIFTDDSGALMRMEIRSADLRRAYYPGGVPIDRAQPITLRAGEEQSAIDLTVVPTMPRLIPLSDRRDALNDPDLSHFATVRGRVSSRTGHPLFAARVRLIGIGQALQRGTVTLQAGTYEFTKVPPGLYVARADKPGYLGAEYGERQESRGEKLRLSAGRTTEHVDFALQRPGTIAGRVVDEYGDPVEGARVRLFQRRFSEGRQRFVEVGQPAGARTNDLGRYRAFNVAPGTYVVSADAGEVLTTEMPGYATTFFPGSMSPNEAQSISVEAAQEIGSIDVALLRAKTSRIAGQIFDSTEQPWNGSLTLSASERSGAASVMSMGARIEPDGRFEFPNLVPGEYVLRAFKGRRHRGIEGDFASQFVTVSGSDVTGLVVRASAGARVTGRVTLDGAGEARYEDVELAAIPVDPDTSPAGMGAFATSEVQADGTFELGGLNGPRRFRLVRAPERWGLKAILAGGVDITDDVITFGGRDQTVSAIEVVLTDRVTRLIATAANRHAQPIAEYTCFAFAIDRDRWYSTSRFMRLAAARTDGTTEIDALPPGEYYVAAVERVPTLRDGDGWQDPEYLESLVSRASRVSLTEGLTTTVALTVK